MSIMVTAIQTREIGHYACHQARRALRPLFNRSIKPASIETQLDLGEEFVLRQRWHLAHPLQPRLAPGRPSADRLEGVKTG